MLNNYYLGINLLKNPRENFSQKQSDFRFHKTKTTYSLLFYNVTININKKMYEILNDSSELNYYGIRFDDTLDKIIDLLSSQDNFNKDELISLLKEEVFDEIYSLYSIDIAMSNKQYFHQNISNELPFDSIEYNNFSYKPMRINGYF